MSESCPKIFQQTNKQLEWGQVEEWEFYIKQDWQNIDHLKLGGGHIRVPYTILSTFVYV